MEKFYITTPIYYVNNPPHCGSAYTTLVADVLARYQRLKGKKVFFLVGTDEHGAKIEKTAKEKGISPQKLCDKNSEIFKKTWQSLNISFDNFIRTSSPQHKKTVQKVLEKLYDKGFIFKGIYQGLYCLACEQYKSKDDLILGKCKEHQKKPIFLKEEGYFFRLSQFEKKIKNLIENDQLEIRPGERKKEILKFLEKGLKDLFISRKKVKWAIPLPFDKKFTIYVWLDAFFNYLTGLCWQGDPKILPEFWPPDFQLMAKDILRVHATIWPALLLALNIPLPKKIFSHGFLTFEGQKMSKSLGNVILPEDLIKKFGLDGTRYLLLTSCSFGKDGDLSLSKLKEKYNSDLTNGLGNLVARILTLAEKLNRIPKIEPQNLIKEKIKKNQKEYEKFFENFRFDQALALICKFISFCDKHLEKNKPWKLEKEKRLKIINNLLFSLAQIAKMLQPFLPETSEKIFQQLGIKPTEKVLKFKIKKEKILFPKINS